MGGATRRDSRQRAGASAQEEWIAIVRRLPGLHTWAQYEANQAQLVRDGQRTGGQI
ncbi:hypothetical protein [Candidatus Amarolinea dominans]|uniref:hypothetical protein n=1 Tax=Candidatus Amarolinea dominans TaxID=3140696 RepID=UPI0031CC824E